MSVDITTIGFLAGALTTVSFVPQAWKIIRERQTAGISLSMYAIYTTGIFCWLIYGWMLGDWPMTIANVVTLILASIILVMKIRLG